jgi:hypothetical protein
MADKIPVGGTIARAYGFAFGNIVNNLGMIWMPVAILYGLVFYFHGAYMNAMTALMSQDFGGIQRVLPFFFASYAIMFVLLTAQVAALTKEAMGLRQGSAWFQFPFGAALWRLMVGYIALFLVCIVLYIATILAGLLGGLVGGVAAGFLVKANGGMTAPVAVAIAAGIFVLIIACAIFYSVVRLSFLLAPAAVDGPRALRRGWALTRGNFWRIFLIGLSIFIPLIIVEVAYLYFIVGPDLFLPPHLTGMTPEAMAQWQQHQRAASLALMQRTQDRWYIVYPLGLIFSVVIYGLMTGASAFAYRALVPLSSEAPAEP